MTEHILTPVAILAEGFAMQAGEDNAQRPFLCNAMRARSDPAAWNF